MNCLWNRGKLLKKTFFDRCVKAGHQFVDNNMRHAWMALLLHVRDLHDHSSCSLLYFMSRWYHPRMQFSHFALFPHKIWCNAADIHPSSYTIIMCSHSWPHHHQGAETNLLKTHFFCKILTRRTQRIRDLFYENALYKFMLYLPVLLLSSQLVHRRDRYSPTIWVDCLTFVWKIKWRQKYH